MAQLKPFYAPISAGSMAHTGAIPQSNVTYQTITPHSGVHSVGIVGVNTTNALPSPISNPIKVGQGHYPVSVTPIAFPRPGVSNDVRLPNYFNHQNI